MDTHKNIWLHKSKKKTEKIIAILTKALKQNDPDKIMEVFGDAENIRGIIIMRGKHSENLRLFLKCFDILIAKEIGEPLGYMGADNRLVLTMLHKNNLPEQIIAEINDIAYHLRDKDMFIKTMDLVEANQDIIKNKQLYLRLKHNLGTWSGEVEMDFEKAVLLNKSILGEVRDSGDKVLEQKVKFGIRIYKIKGDNKAIKPGDLADDFEKMADVLEKAGIKYDAAYSRSEAARAYFALAKRQSKDKVREKEYKLNLAKAKDFASQAVKDAHELGYANLEVVAQEVVSKICTLKEENRSARKFEEKAGDARQNYDYITRHKHLDE